MWGTTLGGVGSPISSLPSSPLVPQPSCIEEQIRSTQLRVQGLFGSVSPHGQVLQQAPVFSGNQTNSEGEEEEDPCGSDEELEQLGDVCGNNEEMGSEEVSVCMWTSL